MQDQRKLEDLCIHLNVHPIIFTLSYMRNRPSCYFLIIVHTRHIYICVSEIPSNLCFYYHSTYHNIVYYVKKHVYKMVKGMFLDVQISISFNSSFSAVIDLGCFWLCYCYEYSSFKSFFYNQFLETLLLNTLYHYLKQII